MSGENGHPRHLRLSDETQVRTAIQEGLHQAWRRHRYVANDARPIRPEYLCTTSIAECLLPIPARGQVPYNETGSRLLYEHPARKVLNYLAMRRTMAASNYSSVKDWFTQTDPKEPLGRGRRIKRFRDGRVDLVLSPDWQNTSLAPGHEHIHCIEVKNLNPSAAAIASDIKRLYDIVSQGDDIKRLTLTGWLGLLATDQVKVEKAIQAARNVYRERTHQLEDLKPGWSGKIESTILDEDTADTPVFACVVRIGKRITPGCQPIAD